MTTADVSDRATHVWSEENVRASEDFDRLYCENHRMVYRTAYGVLGNAHDAEDATQNVTGS